MDIDVNKLLNDSKLQKIFKLKNIEDIYYALDLYVYNFSNDFLIKKKLQNKLFILYLKQLPLKNNHNHYYERALALFINLEYTDEIINYLLKLDIDIRFTTIDKNGAHVPLSYLLAVKIKNQENMKLLLKKVNNPRGLYFKNNYYKEYTDLVRMNIIAGNLDNALALFLSDKYYLINNFEYNYQEIIKRLRTERKIYLKDFNYRQDDLLYQVILTLKMANLDNDSKVKMLISIIKSKKVNLFNISNLIFIKEMLDTESYNKFINYLRDKDQTNEITLYKVVPSNENVICYISLNNALFLDNIVRR